MSTKNIFNFFNISNTIMASSVLDSWLTRLRALIVAQAIQAIRPWISQPPHFVGFMAFKGFLTVIQRKVQRHGDFLSRSHTARSEPNYPRRQQILTNTMLGEGKKNSTSNLHFLTNVEVAGQSEINTFSLAETDLTKISNCHNKHKSLHFYIYQSTCR